MRWAAPHPDLNHRFGLGRRIGLRAGARGRRAGRPADMAWSVSTWIRNCSRRPRPIIQARPGSSPTWPSWIWPPRAFRNRWTLQCVATPRWGAESVVLTSLAAHVRRDRLIVIGFGLGGDD